MQSHACSSLVPRQCVPSPWQGLCQFLDLISVARNREMHAWLAWTHEMGMAFINNDKIELCKSSNGAWDAESSFIITSFSHVKFVHMFGEFQLRDVNAMNVCAQ